MMTLEKKPKDVIFHLEFKKGFSLRVTFSGRHFAKLHHFTTANRALVCSLTDMYVSTWTIDLNEFFKASIINRCF